MINGLVKFKTETLIQKQLHNSHISFYDSTRVTMREISDNLLENACSESNRRVCQHVGPQAIGINAVGKATLFSSLDAQDVYELLNIICDIICFCFLLFSIESFLCQKAPATCLLFDLTCYHQAYRLIVTSEKLQVSRRPKSGESARWYRAGASMQQATC